MSGSSLDGVDIAFTRLEEVRGKWTYSILNAECVPYSEKFAHELAHAHTLKINEFMHLHTRYGRYLGELVNDFIQKNNLHHQVHFIASHGHTILHEPQLGITLQAGDGASIAAVTGLPVISDLRALDVALGGQGAPIVPIADKLLFGEYNYLLNIGGIANITFQNNENRIAFDVCPANQILNALAAHEGLAMDEDGRLAAEGYCQPDVLDDLNSSAYYKIPPPKSLGNEQARELVFPKLLLSPHDNRDLLCTYCIHIAEQVAESVKLFPPAQPGSKMLITGGGAFNTYLVTQIRKALEDVGVEVIIPDAMIIKYKEAVAMALIGALRWRGEVNVLSSATGASCDSSGGAIWSRE